jgi:hypothetical protein
MLGFATMLVEHAKAAGIKVPKTPGNFDKEEFPHFAIYCHMQIGRPIIGTSHVDNAKTIAAIPDSKVKTITFGELNSKLI